MIRVPVEGTLVIMVARVTPEERNCLVCPTVFLVGGSGNKKRSQVYCSWGCRSRAKINANGKVSKTLASEEAAYLAGYIDADGHVSMYYHSSSSTANRYPLLHLSISSTNKTLLDWVRTLTGVGSVYSQHAETETRKATYQWACTNGAAASVLAQTIPFMRVKRPQAGILLETHDRRQDPVQKADLSWQEEARLQMRTLTKRGPVAD